MKTLMVICALFAGVWCNASEITTLTTIPVDRCIYSTRCDRNLINWNVGDTANYQVTLAAFGNVGTVVKSVESTDDTQNAVWVKTVETLQGQTDTTETLMSRTDGKILKLVHNGQEEAIPDTNVQVVSQDYTQVTVPAGTFKAVHVVVNAQGVNGIEVWMNPKDTVMDGTLKQLIPTQFGTADLELTSFVHGARIVPYPEF